MQYQILSATDANQIANYKTVGSGNTTDVFERGAKTTTIGGDRNLILPWFKGDTMYATRCINSIRKGTTLQSVLRENSIYVGGDGLFSENKKVESYIDSFKNKNGELLQDIYAKVVNSFESIGNAFIKVLFVRGTLSFEYIQPQKCRLRKAKKTDVDASFVEINPDWTRYNKKKSVVLPLFDWNLNKKIYKNTQLIYEGVLHIKKEADLYDHYGFNTWLEEALLINEKEHERNLWQRSQIKNGFKKDFLVAVESVTDSVQEQYRDTSKRVTGGENAGGIEPVEVMTGGKGITSPFIPLNADYQFDFEKDDTADQIFTITGFPRSLIGIKSGAAFSVEQVESDYEQYKPKFLKSQTDILTPFSNVFEFFGFGETKINAKNMPPSVIIQGYMPHMNESQKQVVINKVFDAFGFELPETITQQNNG